MDFKESVAVLLAKAIGTEEMEPIKNALETPPNPELGDYAFPCFRLSKTLKRSPQEIAKDLHGKLEKTESVSEVKIAGAYLNFYINKEIFARETAKKIMTERTDYGRSTEGEGKTIVIDYSSPNIAKPLHPGHLRTTVIGQALYNLYSFLGYHCVGINYLGDWGTQFGKMILAYKKWGKKEEIDRLGIDEMTRLYVKFHDEAEMDSSLDEEARSWNLKMQNGDEEALTLWKWFYDVSIREMERIYKRLHVKFDLYRGESYYNDKMNPVVEELKEKNLLVESDGAMIVDLQSSNMPPCLILRRDGGTLYPTRDIAAAFDRKKEFDFHKSLYVTALDQNLHFAQWIKVVDLMGYDWAKDMVHIPYGMTNFEDGKMSTRKGRSIRMEALLEEAAAKTLAIIEEKNPGLENKEEVAEQVGIGALIFHSMYNNRIKDILFSWERMLNFDGETGPYVQYAYVRAVSVLEKAGEDANQLDAETIDFSLLTDPSAMDVLRILRIFPERIAEAVNKYEPFIISRHLVGLSQAFNKYYHDQVILHSDPEVRKARLALVLCIKNVLWTGLSLLGIARPEKM